MPESGHAQCEIDKQRLVNVRFAPFVSRSVQPGGPQHRPDAALDFGGESDEAKSGDDDEGKAKGGDDNGKASGPAPTGYSMNVGVQFGLTDATSDTALKFQGSMSF